MTDQVNRRFWAKVDVREPAECWEWTGARRTGANENYGRFVVDGRRGSSRVVVAHRVSWELVIGPIPDGLQVLHRCDNPPCVNPAHLFLGTQLDNIADQVAKGRKRRGFTYEYPAESIRRGEASSGARLTEEQVARIRTTPKRYGALVALAREFGVSRATVDRVWHRETWQHV